MHIYTYLCIYMYISTHIYTYNIYMRHVPMHTHIYIYIYIDTTRHNNKKDLFT